MSRSGYTDDMEDLWAHIRWRGAVNSAMSGKRGQSFLHELLAALDAMPVKRLVKNALEAEGEVCAIGSVLRQRGSEMPDIHEDDWDDSAWGDIAKVAGIADSMAREIMYENDECGGWKETPEERWTRVRAWVAEQLAPPRRDQYFSEENYRKALAKWQARQPVADMGKVASPE